MRYLKEKDNTDSLNDKILKASSRFKEFDLK